MFGFPSLYIYWAGGPVVLGSGTPQIYNPSGISAPLNSLLNPFTTDLVVNPDEEEEEEEDVSCSASPVAIGEGVAVNSKERVRMELTPPTSRHIMSSYIQPHKRMINKLNVLMYSLFLWSYFQQRLLRVYCFYT